MERVNENKVLSHSDYRLKHDEDFVLLCLTHVDDL